MDLEGSTAGAASLFVTAQDGLRLHVRSYGSRLAPNLPVVCLPGLARTAADFDDLARALGGDQHAPRRVLALDYRGRGLSDYDSDPHNYTLATELADVLAVLTALGVARAVFVGTSRGGLLSMLLACARPTALAGVVLNDIGPVIEPTGLVRIKGYVGKMPQVATFQEGAELLRRLFAGQFTKLSDADWVAYAERTFKVDGRRLVPNYDVRLAKTLESIQFDRPLPPLWNEFDALGRMPLMLIRGANSDLLSEATVAAMQARRPDMTYRPVADQGHAPILSGPELTRAIGSFVRHCDVLALAEKGERE